MAADVPGSQQATKQHGRIRIKLAANLGQGHGQGQHGPSLHPGRQQQQVIGRDATDSIQRSQFHGQLQGRQQVVAYGRGQAL